jgi:hypothetical protein
MRRLIAGIAVLCALVGVSGCGGSSESQVAIKQGLRLLRGELDSWTLKTQRLADAVDQGRISVTKFRPAATALTASELRTLSSRGFRVSLKSQVSAYSLDDALSLTLEEVKNMYCYLFSWYQREDTYPGADELERYFYEYAGGRILPSAPALKLKGAAKLFSEALFEAHSFGEAAANTAMAAMCTWPFK